MAIDTVPKRGRCPVVTPCDAAYGRLRITRMDMYLPPGQFATVAAGRLAPLYRTGARKLPTIRGA